MRFANYQLGQVDVYLSELKSLSVYRINSILSKSRPFYDDIFGGIRKLHSAITLAVRTREATDVVLATLPTLDILVKALHYSRSGMEREGLQEHHLLASKLKSVVEYCCSLFSGDWRSDTVTRYTRYCLEVLRTLQPDWDLDQLESLVVSSARDSQHASAN